MRKSLKGYMTVEASYVMPIVIFLYLLIIFCGFFLYNRCVMSQNNYLLALRGSRFTNAGNNYGEVVYGDRKEKEPDRQYLDARLQYTMRFYPFCRETESRVEITQENVIVETGGYGGTLKIKKEAERINIAAIIERTRKR